MRRRAGLAAVGGLAAALALPGGAGAFYGNGAQIVSADFQRLEQGDDTTQFSAISSGARYVAIQTRARNFFADDDPDPPGQYRQGGIFRFDLETRRLELVADGNLNDEETNAVEVRGAQNPSISSNGRFVAFSTGQRLVPADTNGNIDVYVRDMDAPVRSPAAFDLVSARDGGDVPASYRPRNPSTPGLDPGSEVTRGASISGDGNRVAFRVTEPSSDLPARASTDTPPFQVFVRDRAANVTTLVTREADGGAPAGGAAGPAGISADGTTVVWTGGNAAAQTVFVNGENDSPSFPHYLWRRVADGPAATTRRITGAADPEDPGCDPTRATFFDTSSAGPCYGPLAQQESIPANISDQLPTVSADGRTVAFLTGSGLRGNTQGGPGPDLYVTDMSPGVTRKAGTVELSRETPAGDAETSSPIGGVSMSPDGRFLAVATFRTRFVLPVLRFLDSPRATAGARELYVVDLAARTIERATRATDGGDIDGDVASEATISDGGARVAFTSVAGNLFFGDANQRADAFVIARQLEPGEAPPVPPSAEDSRVVLQEDADRSPPRLGLRARSLRDGRVLLRVRVPSAGGVTAAARARPGRRQRGRRTPMRTVSKATGRGARQVKLVLKVVKRYRARVRRGLVARVKVGYVASQGGRRLRASVRVKFKRKLSRVKGKPPRSQRKR